MQKRNPIAVAVLGFITFGIYSLVWEVKTKGEMNSQGADIPTAWLIIVPFANIWWLWKYSEGVEKVTSAKISGVLVFILLWVIGPIGQAIVQDSFNNVSGVAPVTVAGSSPLIDSPSPTVPAETPEAIVTPAPTSTQPVADSTVPVEQPPSNEV